MNRGLVIGLVAALGLAAGAGAYVLLEHLTGSSASDTQTADKESAPAAPAKPLPTAKQLLGQRRPDFEIKDLDGNTRHISEWDGKIIVLNFWATWCPPCKREFPALIELQKKYGEQGVQMIGLAVDQRQAAREFSDTMWVNYPILAGEVDAMKIGKRYGNRLGQLPYTVFIDRDGRIVHIKRGEITKEEAEGILTQLL